MSMPTLQDTTGDPVADEIASGVIASFGRAFPGRVRGYYLRGSFATGTHGAGSDLDLFVVFGEGFQDRDEQVRAHALAAEQASRSSLLLELLLVSEQQLRQESNLVLALNLKRATRLLHGEDIRATLPEPPSEAYVRAVVHTPYHSYAYPAQRRSRALTYPLGHIDPEGPWYGYDQMLVPGPEGTQVPSTKLLVASVGWTATALVALRTGEYVSDKSAAVALYRQRVADEWAELVAAVYELCRGRWHYLIPAAAADRHILRSLCARALGFQNHYLRRYRGYLLAELHAPEPARQALAARRLGQIRFPDPEVVAALRHRSACPDEQVRSAAAATLAQYPGRAGSAAR